MPEIAVFKNADFYRNSLKVTKKSEYVFSYLKFFFCLHSLMVVLSSVRENLTK